MARLETLPICAAPLSRLGDRGLFFEILNRSVYIRCLANYIFDYNYAS